MNRKHTSDPTPTAAYRLFALSTHPVDHTQVNSAVSVDIRTCTWLHTIHTVHWCADCGSLLCLLYTIYIPGNVMSVTVCLVYVNVQPKYELPNSTLFGQFQKFGKIWAEALSSPATPKEKFNFCTGSDVLFIATFASDLTFLTLEI